MYVNLYLGIRHSDRGGLGMDSVKVKVLCGEKWVRYLDVNRSVTYQCDRPVGHKENHRHHITKTEYFSWPNFLFPHPNSIVFYSTPLEKCPTK